MEPAGVELAQDSTGHPPTCTKGQLFQVAGATFFYVTNNYVTYYIVSSGSSRSPELHKLIVNI
jgi:hypothetical protein